MTNDTMTQNTSNKTKPNFDKGSFSDDSASKAHHLADGASDAAHAAIDKGKQIAEVAGVQAKEARDVLVSTIKENPLAAVGVAFGVGVLFALIRK